MAGKSFTFRLITPQGKLVDGSAAYVSLPAHDGLMGVKPGRAPMVMKLGMGELRVDFADDKAGKGGSRSFLIEEGFVQMVADRLTVLTSRATPAETLTTAEAEAELTAAINKKPASLGNRTEVERLQRDQARARKKVSLAKARAGKGI